MNDALEHQIRAALKQYAASPPPGMVERLARIDYSTRTRRLPAWLRSPRTLAAAGTALAAGVVVAALSLSSAAPMAYAGWNPVPTQPTSDAVSAAAAACNRLGARLTGQPVLTDARGRYTALLYVAGDGVRDCISDGQANHSSVGFDALVLRLYAAPGPDRLGLPAAAGGRAPGFTRSTSASQPLPRLFRRNLQNVRSPTLRAKREAFFRRVLDQGVERHLYGLAGSDVSAVRFVFTGGATVKATVQHGWYFAWWPSSDYPTSVRVTTKSGARILSRMPSSGCNPGASDCVFAGLRPHLANLAPRHAGR